MCIVIYSTKSTVLRKHHLPNTPLFNEASRLLNFPHLAFVYHFHPVPLRGWEDPLQVCLLPERLQSAASQCILVCLDTWIKHMLLKEMSSNFTFKTVFQGSSFVNPLNPELNPICYLLALLGAHHFLHVSRIRVKSLTFRLLTSYIYGAPILDVSRSHITTQHSR